jgi:hypothetical protein
MLMAQSAFQAGALDASLPVLTVVDPVVSIVIGATLFGEAVRTGLFATPIEAVGLVLMTVGVFTLSKAEVVRAVHDEVAHDEVAHDEVAHDEVAHDEVAHDEAPDAG